MSSEAAAIVQAIEVDTGRSKTKHPAYPTYHDSGETWLGRVPALWTLKRLKRVTELVNEKQEASECELPYVGMEHIEAWTGKLYPPAEDTTEIGLSNRFDAGDVLFGKLRPYLAKVAQPDYSGLCSSELLVLRPDGVLGRFLHYYMLAPDFINVVDASTYGAKMPRASWDFIGDLLVACPRDSEQTTIASFLDRETAKIGALVRKKERLIELLQEKRTALISHAVTKGLNPDAPMKDSSVGWLGAIPAHWSVARLKHATSQIVDCPHETPSYSPDGQYLVIRTSDVDQGTLLPEGMKRVDEIEYLNRIRRECLQRNDIVYSREGGRWGHAALVDADDQYCLGQRMMQFRTNATYDARYLMWHLNSPCVYRQGEVDTVGSASPHVNVATICNYRIAEPPIEEQQQIAESIARVQRRFEKLRGKVELAIGALREYRTSLISAAVTGKIDVRESARVEEATDTVLEAAG